MGIKIFDIVKYEKEKAMERFDKLQRIKTLLKFFEILFVLILLYWSTNQIPLAVRFSSKIVELLNPHLVFIIGNSIILAVFLLCKQNSAENSPSTIDLYEAYSLGSEASLPPLGSPEVKTIVVDDDEKLDKKELRIVQTISSDSPKPKMQCEADEAVEILSSSSSKGQCEEAEVAIAEAEQEIRRFERTFSERLRVEIAVRPRKELRRSETERRTVEHLTNEEFKLAVDAFLDRHRLFSKERITE